MKRTSNYLLLALPLVLASCRDEPLVRNIPVDEQDDASEVAASAGTAPSTLNTVEAAMRAPLQPVGGSGVSGEVTLVEQGLATAVQATLTGVAEGETLLGHVHQGNCATADESRASAADLGPVRLGPGGTAAFVIERQLQDLANGQYSIGFHRSQGTPDVACADLVAPRPAAG